MRLARLLSCHEHRTIKTTPHSHNLHVWPRPKLPRPSLNQNMVDAVPKPRPLKDSCLGYLSLVGCSGGSLQTETCLSHAGETPNHPETSTMLFRSISGNPRNPTLNVLGEAYLLASVDNTQYYNTHRQLGCPAKRPNSGYLAQNSSTLHQSPINPMPYTNHYKPY